MVTSTEYNHTDKMNDYRFIYSQLFGVDPIVLDYLYRYLSLFYAWIYSLTLCLFTKTKGW